MPVARRRRHRKDRVVIRIPGIPPVDMQISQGKERGAPFAHAEE